MKLIVDIPEDMYDDANILIVKDLPELKKIIANGVPLPKGHGRLIDADGLIQDIIYDNQLCIFNSERERIVHDKMVDFAIDRITEASPIIEADKKVVNEE